MGGTDSVMQPPAPPPYPTLGMIAFAEAGKEKMAYMVGGQVMQTQMQTNMMTMMGMERSMMHSASLDAKLEVASMNYEARMKESKMDYDVKLRQEANRHVESLAKSDEIELDSESYAYPYQYG